MAIIKGYESNINYIDKYINDLNYIDITEFSRRATNEPVLIKNDILVKMYLEWAKKIITFEYIKRNSKRS
ncbi:MAG: hypothetical protein CMC90_00805 [Flavobacteriaceae bacterium]|nr:hypothetical protein [Flavobacteriaceae bacterium]